MTALSDAGVGIGPWQVRILDEAGLAVRGSGVLISARHVLTCAHVLGDGPGPPAGTFKVSFPRTEGGLELDARVADGGWFPGSGTSEGDVAVLELPAPVPGAAWAEVARGKRLHGRSADVYGTPAALSEEGVWVRVEISYTVGPRNERVQLSPAKHVPVEEIVRGFSGGGVVDHESGRVVGIVATSFSMSDRSVAYMIPMETVGALWPPIAEMLDGPAAAERPVPAETLDHVLALLSRREALSTPEGLQWLVERLPAGASGALGAGGWTARDLVLACRLPSDLRTLADLVLFRDGAPVGAGPIEDALVACGAVPAEPVFQPEDLGPSTRRDLYELLMLQEHFVDRARRETYLWSFRQRVLRELDLHVEIEVTDSAGTDARVLIGICGRRPGLTRLIIKDFPFGESGTGSFGELALLVDGISPLLVLTVDERARLARILGEAQAHEIAIAHQHALPLDTRPRPAPDDLAGLVRHIELHNQRSGELPPIFVFTEVLARRAAARADELRRWQDRAAARLRRKLSELEDMRREVGERLDEAGDAGPPVLSIQLAPDRLQAERYRPAITLRYGASPVQLDASDTSENLTAIRARVSQVIAAKRVLIEPHLDRLVVELVLPRSLITEPVDQWELPTLAELPIGQEMPVVLRAWERVGGPHFRNDRWRRKSDLVRSGTAPAPDAVHIVAAEDRPSPAELARLLQDERVLALVCERPVGRQPGLRPLDEYAAALHSGIPLILWSRHAAPAPQLREWITGILTSLPLRSLPDSVAGLRAEEFLSDATDGLGAHLSILADLSVVADEPPGRQTPGKGRGLSSPGRITL